MPRAREREKPHAWSMIRIHMCLDLKHSTNAASETQKAVRSSSMFVNSHAADMLFSRPVCTKNSFGRFVCFFILHLVSFRFSIVKTNRKYSKTWNVVDSFCCWWLLLDFYFWNVCDWLCSLCRLFREKISSSKIERCPKTITQSEIIVMESVFPRIAFQHRNSDENETFFAFAWHRFDVFWLAVCKSLWNIWRVHIASDF